MSQMQKTLSKHSIEDEKIVLAALLQHGNSIFSDIQPLLNSDDFFSTEHQAIYSCVEKVLNDNDIKSITVDMIVSTAKTLGLEKLLDKSCIDNLSDLKNKLVNKDETITFSRRVQFWSVIRQFSKRLSLGLNYLDKLTGNEKITDIVGKQEEIIFDFIPSLLQEDEMVHMGEFAFDYINHLANNPVESPGLPTGFPRYDKAIGGGYRRGSVNVIGARPKVGKSTLCLNIAKNLVVQNIPVLYLDTELRKEIQATKWAALVSKTGIEKIETGKFTSNEGETKQVFDSLEKAKKLPFYHINISGKTPEEYLSIMRRWVAKHVGYDSNGKTKDCLIILDYLKTMDLGELGGFTEWQHLGDVITKMQNFAVKYDLPVLSMVQLNRDAISRDDSGVIAGSDRILWLCSNMSYLKKKNDEDYASGDSKSYGNLKLTVVDTRFGAGMDYSSEYINIIGNLDRSEMIEGKYNHENIGAGIINVENDLFNNDEDEIGF